MLQSPHKSPAQAQALAHPISYTEASPARETIIQTDSSTQHQSTVSSLTKLMLELPALYLVRSLSLPGCAAQEDTFGTSLLSISLPFHHTRCYMLHFTTHGATRLAPCQCYRVDWEFGWGWGLFIGLVHSVGWR